MKPVLLLLTFLAGCTSYSPASWGTDFRARDGSNLQISGTPIYSDIGESLLYLCPAGHTGDPTGHCLDAIAPAALVAKLRQSSDQCVVLSGKFLAFGPDRVGAGYYRSDIGYIEVARLAPCHVR